MKDIFVELDKSATDIVYMLRQADPTAVVAEEEKLDGLDDIIHIGLTLTPAVAFVLGRYFEYRKANVKAFKLRDKEGHVVSATGDVAPAVLEYLIEKEKDSQK